MGRNKTYGGSGDDFMTSLKPTSDGGFIIGAGSDSNISGEKSENSRGGLDFWILKVDDSGNIEWQKTYGGAQPDFDTNIFQTSDGGYFVSGYSDSGISGDKTVPSKGQRDYWVLKLNSSGEISWQKAIGGSAVDRLIISNQSEDGGYLVGGYSHSGISGDKTGELRGVIDLWVYKIGNDGNMVWQKTIGGSQTDYLRTIRQKLDGNFLITGYSNSNISGEKTENTNGGYDMWFLLMDPNGNILGQNTIGGSEDESAGYSLILNDGYIFAVASASNISGDKTDNSRGLEDYWLFKTTNSLLNISEIKSVKDVVVYPNPTKGSFVIDLGKFEENIEIKVSDTTGKNVFVANYKDLDKIELKLNLAPAVYFIHIKANNEIHTKKLIKL